MTGIHAAAAVAGASGPEEWKGRRSGDRDDASLREAARGDGEQADRAVRLAPAIGRRSGVEDAYPIARLIERDMGVAEHDQPGTGEPPAQAGDTAGRRAAVV